MRAPRNDVDCRSRRLYNPAAFLAGPRRQAAQAEPRWFGRAQTKPRFLTSEVSPGGFRVRANPKTGNAVIAIDLPNPRRLALSVVLGQVAVTLLCALLGLLIAGPRAALSALLGGGISSVASLAMALVAFGRTAAKDPQRALRAFFAGEAAKVAVVIVLFAVVLKTMRVVPLAMLGSYVATFFVFWVILFRCTGSSETRFPWGAGRSP